jgi:hypothetical protein
MTTPPRIALTCSGLGRVARGYETFAAECASVPRSVECVDVARRSDRHLLHTGARAAWRDPAVPPP